jgi:hypothetical protein
MSDAVHACECAKRNVKQVLVLESQFYVFLVNFRNSLYALRCVRNIFLSIQLYAL